MPCPSATSAVKNRTVVPLLAIYKSANFCGMSPPWPPTTSVCPSCCFFDGESPACDSASIITCVSSLAKRTCERRSASRPARRRSEPRLVRLLEPGGRATASSGACSGWISMLSGTIVSPVRRMVNVDSAKPQGQCRAYCSAIFHKCLSLRTYNAPSEIAGRRLDRPFELAFADDFAFAVLVQPRRPCQAPSWLIAYRRLPTSAGVPQ